MSYILRHRPDQYHIVLDSEGWCSLEDIKDVLNREIDKNITISVMEDVVAKMDKKRFEIKEGKIRAFYGHSMSTKIVKEKTEPPVYLYHGTARKSLDSIKQNGLQPMDRQYVHLSETVELAALVGKRRDNKPYIIRVLAKEAWNNGIAFYHGNEDTWLSEVVNPEFLQFENEY